MLFPSKKKAAQIRATLFFLVTQLYTRSPRSDCEQGSDGDPITKGGEKIFQKQIPGVQGQSHTTIKGGGHFLQEDCGEDFDNVVVDFMNKN